MTADTQPGHDDLWAICKQLPQDYEPWGKQERELPERFLPDCSCGCRWYVTLEYPLGMDWGICANPASHRVGLLTFEHQGCPQYDDGIVDGGSE